MILPIQYFKNRAIVLLLLACSLLLQQCGLMSFTGTSVDPKIQTFSIKEFKTRDPNTQIQIASKLTDALIDSISMLNIMQVKKEGTIHYEGFIKSYDKQLLPTDNQKNHTKKKITIEVEVLYTNSINNNRNFNKNFQKSAEGSNEAKLVEDLIEQLAKEIVQDSIDDW